MLILKGIIIGIGKIIPGVSGSILAISLGVYEKLIYSINNVFKLKKKDIVFVAKICIGIIISIAFLSKIVLNFLNNNFLVTMFFFIGLIIGSMESINNNVINKDKWILFVSLFIVLIFGIITINNEINIHNIILKLIYFLFLGYADAIATIVPGISGTATLMMLGGYDQILFTFSNIFNLTCMKSNLIVIIPFIIGFILGCIITAKIIDYLFKNKKSKTYSLIVGFSYGTIILMLIKSLTSNYSIMNLILGIILFVIGFFISKKINRLFTID